MMTTLELFESLNEFSKPRGLTCNIQLNVGYSGFMENPSHILVFEEAFTPNLLKEIEQHVTCETDLVVHTNTSLVEACKIVIDANDPSMTWFYSDESKLLFHCTEELFRFTINDMFKDFPTQDDLARFAEEHGFDKAE